MNLHAIVAPYVSAINPFAPVTIQFSTGYTTASDGSQIPTYDTPFAMQAQIQALTGGDLRQLDGLNLNGTMRGIYLYGDVQGVVRVAAKGGDLITFVDVAGGFPAGSVWLVAQALETWNGADGGWCKVAVVLQKDGAFIPGQLDFSDTDNSGLIPTPSS